MPSYEACLKSAKKLMNWQWHGTGEKKLPDGRMYLTYFPFPTEACILCPHLTREGLDPACVKHCMAACMKYGRVKDLSKELGKKPRMVLWVP